MKAASKRCRHVAVIVAIALGGVVGGAGPVSSGGPPANHFVTLVLVLNETPSPPGVTVHVECTGALALVTDIGPLMFSPGFLFSGGAMGAWGCTFSVVDAAGLAASFACQTTDGASISCTDDHTLASVVTPIVATGTVTLTFGDPASASTQLVPDPPTDVKAGLGSVVVTWSPPGFVGGVTGLTGYEITASPGGATYAAGPAATSLTIACPRPGTYSYTVRAVNEFGSSVASVPSNAVTVTAAQCHDPATVVVAPPTTTG